MIDWMAWHKLNVLHWHLTDDQGWRIEIRKYPRLTSVGAWRIPAVVPGTPAPGRYGGFYSQDEVRDIVRFAATRNVRIVPEIDMPGHAQAAIAAYPELGSIDAKPTLPVSNRWGVHSHLFNLEPGTFKFLENVLGEVLQLFPSQFIHIGGDEAVKDEWNASAHVRARAKKLGIHDAGALQVYFTQKISRYLAAHGRRTVGWDEILQPGVSTGAVIMAWHGAAGAHAAAIEGNDTVLAPDPTLYFDHRQSSLPNEPPGRLDVISLEDVYRFEPHDSQLTDEQQRHILGLQAEIWTEHIQTEQRVEWMALPRAAALAEVGWSAQKRSWPDFLNRLSSMSARYRAFDLDYADSAFIGPSQGSRTGISRAGISPVDQRTAARRTSHELDQCSDGVGLLLEPRRARGTDEAPLAVDIMNPCWIYRDVDLTQGPRFTAAVSALPFNYELGRDAAKIRVGDNSTPTGELEVRVGDCAGAILKVLPLPPAASSDGVAELPAQKLPPLAGRHNVCLRFARPSLDPMWALDWVQIGD
jgi:hexosaminidase